MNKKITVNLALAIAIIAMTVTFVVTMILSMQMFNRTVSGVREKEIMYNKLSEMDKSARENYYGDIVDDSLYDYIAAGYVTGMGDRDARYYTAKQYLEYLNIQNGVVMGVGVDVVKDAAGYARVIKVYAGSPAEESGITKDCYITRIGETDVKTLALAQVNSQLLGESGTSVTLTVVSIMNGEERAVEIQRREYETPATESQLSEDGAIGYIKISAFNTKTPDEVKTTIGRWQEESEPVQGLVFDVRGCTGGSLTNAMQVIDYLCPVGTIASQQNKDGSTTTLETSDAAEVKLPMIVLVNGGTSYASELFATSIREFEKGRILGTRTAGKGTIQCRPVALSDGSAFSYTVGLLLSKGGTSFNGTGISPDVEILLSAEEEANFYAFTVDTDPQIRRAFEAMSITLGRDEIEANTTPPDSSSQTEESSSSSDTGDSSSESKDSSSGSDSESGADSASGSSGDAGSDSSSEDEA